MKTNVLSHPRRQRKVRASSGGPFRDTKLSSCSDFPLPQEEHREITLVLVGCLSETSPVTLPGLINFLMTISLEEVLSSEGSALRNIRYMRKFCYFDQAIVKVFSTFPPPLPNFPNPPSKSHHKVA